MATYLVSGESDVMLALPALRMGRRKVRFDTQVEFDAAMAIEPYRRVIVIAHGDGLGRSVTLVHSKPYRSAKWLFAGMKNAPTGSRIYLYSCRAGREVPRALDKCEVFGHFGVVPIPYGEGRALIMKFLLFAESIVDSDDKFSWKKWSEKLAKFARDLYAIAYKEGRNSERIAYLAMLVRSFEDVPV